MPSAERGPPVAERGLEPLRQDRGCGHVAVLVRLGQRLKSREL